MNKTTMALSLSLAMAAAGCLEAGVDAGTEDARDDAFATDGKADGLTLTREELAAILQVANTASVATLRADVTLAKRTAENIVSVRATAPYVTWAGWGSRRRGR